MVRRLLCLLALIILPLQAGAQRTLTVDIGTGKSIWQVIESIVAFLAGSIGVIATAMFIVGAFMITISGVKEDYKQKGKDFMIGAAMSLGIVLGAYAIYRTISFFLLG